MATVNSLLTVARGEVGVKESPANSNRVKYNTWYYGKEVSGSAYPWCMVFVQWCCARAGVILPVRTASCSALMRAAKKIGAWVTSGYQAGDIVIYDFDGNGGTDHCGIVENVLSGGVVAIEGNTAQGNDANGGQVQRRVRASRLIVGALRPQYTKEAKMDNTPGKYAEEAVHWAVESGLMQGSADGDLKLHDSVTREQLMVFLYRLRKME
ncbi:CHAP domain-containing protein [Oscillibacter hominis]|uniref:CHAP domain-containing protein n=1 Tax=Oscillibacter hominis TaxID=2763056 RepID=UPI001FACA10D|nr:CHAP domain-containing protein [Oscillibacter hominis]